MNAIAKEGAYDQKKCPEFIILQDENSCTSKRYYSNMSVLIISNSDNTHANAVESELLERSTEVIRIDMDSILKLPSSFSMHFPFQDNFICIGKNIPLSEITGIFVHHPRLNIPESFGTDEIDRDLFASGWKNLLNWLEIQFPTAIWINRPSFGQCASSVVLQLDIASKHGIRTPDSIFTNSIEALKQFALKHEKIILKGSLVGVTMDSNRLLSHIITPDSIDPKVLLSSPCLFQEYIEKDFELRVHVLNDIVLSCKIESQSNKHTQIDWRNYAISQTPHRPIDLNEKLLNILRAITKELQLELGIMDLIVTPSGDAVFLECNSQGHWLWIEKLTGLSITKAVVDRLQS